jgi:hypothetical protein
MNKLDIILGIVVLVIVGATAPMPLVSAQNVTIYPNLLFDVPLTLFGVLLLLYGMVAENGPPHETAVK